MRIDSDGKFKGKTEALPFRTRSNRKKYQIKTDSKYRQKRL